MAEKEIYVDQLRVGLYIKLNLPWFSHPFMFNAFKIKNEDQIKTIKSLGLEKIIYIPEKSDVEPLSSVKKTKINEIKKDITKDVKSKLDEKFKKIRELKNINKSLLKARKEYFDKIKQVNNCFARLLRKDEKSLNELREVVNKTIDLIMSHSNLVIHLIVSSDSEFEEFNHSVNVMVLSVMVGKAMGLDEEKLKNLGVGALCHDVGKLKIEKKYWKKSLDKMSDAEKELVKLHPKYGVEIVTATASIPQDVYDIIYQHHERFLGGGFPLGIRGEKINKLARIVTICNIYDKLCNPYDPNKAMSPFEALKYMFLECDTIIDFKIFDIFLKKIGIYPPGTVVMLNNEMIGKVITTYIEHPNRPSLILYDPNVPKKDAALFNLIEYPDLYIVKTIKPSDLDIKIAKYLDVNLRVNYYVDSLDE